MSDTNTHNDDFGKDVKERLKTLSIVIVVFAIAYLVNKGLWALNTIAVLSIIIALIPVKLVLIVLRFFQLWRVENKKALLLFFLPIFLTFAFLFDFGTVPELWVYRLGKETQGNAIEFIKTTKSRFIVYEFSVDNVSFKRKQVTSIPYYESLSPGAKVNVKYNPDNPKISFLVDVEYLKNQTTFTLFMGFGIMAAMFASEIQEKISSFLKNIFGAKRSA